MNGWLSVGLIFIGLVIGFFSGYHFCEGLHVCDYCHRRGLIKFYRTVKISGILHFENICKKCAKENNWYTIRDFDAFMEKLNKELEELPK